MKIFGISMVRNEADIIGLTVLHHLSLGLDRILILDNGSTDGTDEILRLLGKEDERVKWIRDDSPFDQATITTELAREAYRQGADWVVPFDADEFWWSEGEDFCNLLRDSRAGALWTYPVNFIQVQDQHESRPEALLTMTRRAVETIPIGNLARQMLETHQVGMVQISYPPKYVSRPNNEIEIARGNHIVFNVKGEDIRCEKLICLHAPLRSRALLESKMERSQRLTQAGVTASAWHVWHWARMIEQGNLDLEWVANSYKDEHLHVYGKRYPVVFDPRLSNAVAPLVDRVSEISLSLSSK